MSRPAAAGRGAAATRTRFWPRSTCSRGSTRSRQRRRGGALRLPKLVCGAGTVEAKKKKPLGSDALMVLQSCAAEVHLQPRRGEKQAAAVGRGAAASKAEGEARAWAVWRGAAATQTRWAVALNGARTLLRPTAKQFSTGAGKAELACNRFARDDKEPGPSWGKQLPGERPRGTAET
jgi:hypothetical protein